MKDHEFAQIYAVACGYVGLSVAAFILMSSVAVAGVQANTFLIQGGASNVAAAVLSLPLLPMPQSAPKVSQATSVAPAAPTGLLAICSQDGTKVTLSWATSDAASYALHTYNSTNPALEADATVVGQTSYVANVTPGATYYWWVASANASGQTSNIVLGDPLTCIAH